jgi:hypothetical protein
MNADNSPQKNPIKLGEKTPTPIYQIKGLRLFFIRVYLRASAVKNKNFISAH